MKTRLASWAAVMAALVGVLPDGRAESYTFTTIEVPGANYTRAFGINDSGQIVGEYQDTATFRSHGYLLSEDNFSTIDFPGSWNTSARGISDTGQITGYIFDGTTVHGFLLSGDGFSMFDAPNSVGTQAQGINDSGQIVGNYGNGRFNRGFLLSGDLFSTIDYGLGNTVARGINNSGQIVGTSFSGGFLLNGGVFSTIHVPGSITTSAIAINNAGQILGTYVTEGGLHIYLLSGDVFNTIDLPVGAIPNGLNDAGQIVGLDGRGHGFLATPVPEPATLTMLVTGILGVLACALARLEVR